MTRAWTITAALALSAALGAASNAETIEKNGKTASGDTCSVKVEKHADGSISAAGAFADGHWILDRGGRQCRCRERQGSVGHARQPGQRPGAQRQHPCAGT